MVLGMVARLCGPPQEAALSVAPRLSVSLSVRLSSAFDWFEIGQRQIKFGVGINEVSGWAKFKVTGYENVKIVFLINVQ